MRSEIQKTGMEVLIDRKTSNQWTQKENGDYFIRSELLPKYYGRFKVLDVDETTVTIDQNGSSNKVSRDQVRKVPLTVRQSI